MKTTCWGGIKDTSRALASVVEQTIFASLTPNGSIITLSASPCCLRVVIISILKRYKI